MRRTAVAAALVLLLSGLLSGCSGGSSGSGGNPVTAQEASSVLAAHARALLEKDRSAFLEGVGSAAAAAAFRGRQQAQFDNIADVPLSTYAYRVGQRSGDLSAQRAQRMRFGDSAVAYVVTLRIALRGPDRIAAPHTLWWTFARQGDRVVAVADDGLVRAGGTSWRGPWDFAPLTVVQTRYGVIMGHPDNAAVLEVLGRVVDQAVPTVTGVWGRDWSRFVGVVVASSATELAATLGPNARSTQIVAAATSDGQDATTGALYGQRLVVDADRVRGLSAVGLRIVVQHEITHIAAGEQTTDASPSWLVEGFADYVGNLRSGQSVALAAAELRAQVRRGQVPTALPDAVSFQAAGTAAQAYEASWLACRLIAARVGVSGLVRLYRQVGASPLPADQAAAQGLRSVLGEAPARFVAQWRTYLRTELGR